MARAGGRIHWLGSFATETEIYGVVAAESEDEVRAYWKAAGVENQQIALSRIVAELGPAMAA